MDRRHAYFASDLQTRESDDGKRYIDGYFAVFGQETKLCDRCFEQILPGAFDDSLKDGDIRCLFNHDAGSVLGRTSSGTLQLQTDKLGLRGTVEINPNDRMAADVYERVKRRDISGCSFGFTPTEESYEEREDGIHWRVGKVELFEVSVCTFPAYPQTEIQARMQDFEQQKQRSAKHRTEQLKKRLEELKC